MRRFFEREENPYLMLSWRRFRRSWKTYAVLHAAILIILCFYPLLFAKLREWAIVMPTLLSMILAAYLLDRTILRYWTDKRKGFVDEASVLPLTSVDEWWGRTAPVLVEMIPYFIGLTLTIVWTGLELATRAHLFITLTISWLAICMLAGFVMAGMAWVLVMRNRIIGALLSILFLALLIVAAVVIEWTVSRHLSTDPDYLYRMADQLRPRFDLFQVNRMWLLCTAFLLPGPALIMLSVRTRVRRGWFKAVVRFWGSWLLALAVCFLGWFPAAKGIESLVKFRYLRSARELPKPRAVIELEREWIPLNALDDGMVFFRPPSAFSPNSLPLLMVRDEVVKRDAAFLYYDTQSEAPTPRAMLDEKGELFLENSLHNPRVAQRIQEVLVLENAQRCSIIPLPDGRVIDLGKNVKPAPVTTVLQGPFSVVYREGKGKVITTTEPVEPKLNGFPVQRHLLMMDPKLDGYYVLSHRELTLRRFELDGRLRYTRNPFLTHRLLCCETLAPYLPLPGNEIGNTTVDSSGNIVIGVTPPGSEQQPELMLFGANGRFRHFETEPWDYKGALNAACDSSTLYRLDMPSSPEDSQNYEVRRYNLSDLLH